MSQENVEIVRRGYDYVVRTGKPLPEIFHRDFVWDMSHFSGWPERKIYTGIEGVSEFIADWIGAWDDWNVEFTLLRDVGDKVIAIATQHGRSKATGLQVEMEFGQVWSMKSGQQIRTEVYSDPREALEAVGLSE